MESASSFRKVPIVIVIGGGAGAVINIIIISTYNLSTSNCEHDTLKLAERRGSLWYQAMLTCGHKTSKPGEGGVNLKVVMIATEDTGMYLRFRWSLLKSTPLRYYKNKLAIPKVTKYRRTKYRNYIKESEGHNHTKDKVKNRTNESYKQRLLINKSTRHTRIVAKAKLHSRRFAGTMIIIVIIIIKKRTPY